MWTSVIDLLTSVLPTVLGWFGVGKASDSPSPDFTAGRALGAAETANDNQGKVLADVEKARAVERASDADRLRGKSDVYADDGFKRD
jgi:hypothetical protein